MGNGAVGLGNLRSEETNWFKGNSMGNKSEKTRKKRRKRRRRKRKRRTQGKSGGGVKSGCVGGIGRSTGEAEKRPDSSFIFLYLSFFLSFAFLFFFYYPPIICLFSQDNEIQTD